MLRVPVALRAAIDKIVARWPTAASAPAKAARRATSDAFLYDDTFLGKTSREHAFAHMATRVMLKPASRAGLARLAGLLSLPWRSCGSTTYVG